MEFTIDQILLMQYIIIDVRRRTQELTISEIVSREIDPVLFILLLTPHRFRSASHSVPYRYRWRSMIGHTDGSVLNDDSECPGRGSRTPAVRARSSSSQPVVVGSAAGRPG